MLAISFKAFSLNLQPLCISPLRNIAAGQLENTSTGYS